MASKPQGLPANFYSTAETRSEKGVDVQLAAHMLAFAFDNQYDTAILVSNDGDFAPVVAEVIRLNKTVENAEFSGRLPSFLSKCCTSVFGLDKTVLKPRSEERRVGKECKSAWSK